MKRHTKRKFAKRTKGAARGAGVAILLPDGSLAGPGYTPQCRRCGAALPWSRLDELAWKADEIGIVCWRCESEIWQNF